MNSLARVGKIGITHNGFISYTMPTYVLYLLVEDEALKANPYYNFNVLERDKENAGYDLLTAETFVGSAGKPHLLNLGVKAMLVRKDTTEASHFWLAPRSSIYKSGHQMVNSLGVIDMSYRGVLKAPVVPFTEQPTGFKAGDRHFQILAPDMGWISEVRRVDVLPETARGAGGFGSTGK